MGSGWRVGTWIWLGKGDERVSGEGRWVGEWVSGWLGKGSACAHQSVVLGIIFERLGPVDDTEHAAHYEEHSEEDRGYQN